MPSIVFVLVEPREEGNVGMVARAMANFGLGRLVIVGASELPGAVDFVIARSAGRKILDAVERASDLRAALEPFHVAVAVSRRRGKHRNSDMGPGKILTFLKELPSESTAAFVFGREADGLTVDEVAQCARTLTIPTADEAPSLNLAQAAAIVAYSIFGGPEDESPDSRKPDKHQTDVAPEPRATQADLEELYKALEASLESIGFLQGDRATDSMLTLRRMLARSLPTARESRLLRSLARKIEKSQ